VPGEELVEFRAASRQAEARERLQFRPREHEGRHPAAVDPEAVVVDPARGLRDVETQADHRPGAPGRQPVTAHLVAGELGLLQQRHLQAAAREVPRGRRAAGAGPHHDDVGFHDARARPRSGVDHRSPPRRRGSTRSDRVEVDVSLGTEAGFGHSPP